MKNHHVSWGKKKKNYSPTSVLHLLALRVALELPLQAARHVGHVGHDALHGALQDLLVAEIDLLLELRWDPLPHLGWATATGLGITGPVTLEET